MVVRLTGCLTKLNSDSAHPPLKAPSRGRFDMVCSNVSPHLRTGLNYEKLPGLGDLDDAVLVNIFGRLDPLPHLFSICGVSKRFQKLAGDGRLWLHVTGEGREVQGAIGHRSLSYPTLDEAVVASRPGDTIILEPGAAHAIKDVTVDWPLRLMGGGKAAEDTSLLCLLGADSAFIFRASGMLLNLSVMSEQSACVTHHSGRLTVQSCLLQSMPAPGLEHLYTPLVTLARSPLLKGSSRKQSHRDESAGSKRKRSGGCLSVKETKIRGGEGMRAVRAGGTGKIAGARVINFSSDTLFWFEVDSVQPAGPQRRPIPGQTHGPEEARLDSESPHVTADSEGPGVAEGQPVDLGLKSKAWAACGAVNNRSAELTNDG